MKLLIKNVISAIPKFLTYFKGIKTQIKAFKLGNRQYFFEI